MDDRPTTVAWVAVEPHWKVVSREGEEVGEVFVTVGDRQADIFNGLAVTRHGGPAMLHDVVDKPRYVAREQVEAIRPGAVRLTLSAEEVERLPEYDSDAALRALADEATGEGAAGE